MCILPLEQPRGSAEAMDPRQRLRLALDALTGGTVSRLARDHHVSRQFVRRQRDRAADALEAAFEPPAQHDGVLFHLPVTRAWLRQLVLALVLTCHSSYRGACELLRDLFDHEISIGSVH